jgi:hypothetical protein
MLEIYTQSRPYACILKLTIRHQSDHITFEEAFDFAPIMRMKFAIIVFATRIIARSFGGARFRRKSERRQPEALRQRHVRAAVTHHPHPNVRGDGP